MPIRINLLAEAQASESLRRRDPVKRAIVVGILLVGLMLMWSSSLQLKAMIANRDLGRLQAAVDTHTNEFQLVTVHQKKITEMKTKLKELQRLNGHRFLQGNLLNALQQINVSGVRLMRLRVEQSFVSVTTLVYKTNEGRIMPIKTTTEGEKVAVALDARDSGMNPGDQVNKFKAAIEHQPYFKSSLVKTNAVRLVNLSPPQTVSDGKPFVSFTLECYYPERPR
jgi:hypothetical protein